MITRVSKDACAKGAIALLPEYKLHQLLARGNGLTQKEKEFLCWLLYTVGNGRVRAYEGWEIDFTEYLTKYYVEYIPDIGKEESVVIRYALSRASIYQTFLLGEIVNVVLVSKPKDGRTLLEKATAQLGALLDEEGI